MSEKCPYSEIFWSVFSPNAGKYRPKRLRMRTLFMQFKRNTLKISFTFFDSFTFIIAITLPAKALYKNICCQKYTWCGGSCNNGIQKCWMKYLNELNSLNKDEINCTFCVVIVTLFILGFVIVPEKLIALLLLRRCRVVPMRKLSILRMELLRYMLLSELYFHQLVR